MPRSMSCPATQESGSGRVQASEGFAPLPTFGARCSLGTPLGTPLGAQRWDAMSDIAAAPESVGCLGASTALSSAAFFSAAFLSPAALRSFSLACFFSAASAAFGRPSRTVKGMVHSIPSLAQRPHG